MAINIISPRFSFVQFGGTDTVQSCSHPGGSICLPVYQYDDVAFQFVLATDTIEEADALCTLDGSGVELGLIKEVGGIPYKIFTEKPERFRLSDFQVLFNWSHGLPGFDEVIELDDCFYIIVLVGEQVFTSNCFKRVRHNCYSAVIEYGAEANQFGFSYCGGEPIEDAAANCNPTFIEFINQSLLSINYTASMLAKYGNIPTVKVWIYNENNELQDMAVQVLLNSYPTTQIDIDFGGPASGIIKIS